MNEKTQNSYTCVLIFKEITNKTNFQLLIFNYAQFLKQLGAGNIAAYNKDQCSRFVLTATYRRKISRTALAS